MLVNQRMPEKIAKLCFFRLFYYFIFIVGWMTIENCTLMRLILPIINSILFCAYGFFLWRFVCQQKKGERFQIQNKRQQPKRGLSPSFVNTNRGDNDGNDNDTTTIITLTKHNRYVLSVACVKTWLLNVYCLKYETSTC